MIKVGATVKSKNLLVHFFLIFFVLITLGPFLWMIFTSFKTFEESIRLPITILPQEWYAGAYPNVWGRFPFLSFYFNTFVVLIITVVLQVFISSLAAYAFARLEFPFKNALFVAALALLMVPGQIFLIPHFQIMVDLNLTNTLTALWLPRIFGVFGTFLLRQFFMTLPKSLDEAARIDGCNFFQIYLLILMPLMKPAIISLAIITGLNSWRELLWPLIINTSPDRLTLSAGLAMLIGEHTTVWPHVMAASTLAVWPMIILFFFFQRQFIEGIAITGTKD